LKKPFSPSTPVDLLKCATMPFCFSRVGLIAAWSRNSFADSCAVCTAQRPPPNGTQPATMLAPLSLTGKKTRSCLRPTMPMRSSASSVFLSMASPVWLSSEKGVAASTSSQISQSVLMKYSQMPSSETRGPTRCRRRPRA